MGFVGCYLEGSWLTIDASSDRCDAAAEHFAKGPCKLLPKVSKGASSDTWFGEIAGSAGELGLGKMMSGCVASGSVFAIGG